MTEEKGNYSSEEDEELCAQTMPEFERMESDLEASRPLREKLVRFYFRYL